MRYGDTSKIVTLFTKDHGRVSVLAKGARAGKARFGAALESGAHIAAVYYVKVSRELQTLSQADVQERFRRIPTSLPATAAMLQMVEVVYVLTHPGERHTEVYDLLVEGLRAADRRDEGLADLLIAYRLKAISALGFAPSFDRCIRCGSSVTPSKVAHIRYHVRKGGPLCEACEQDLISLPGRMGGREDWTESVVSGPALLQFQRLMRDPLAQAGDEPAPEVIRSEMEAMLRLYERFHLDQRTPLRTSDLVRDVIQSP